MDPAQGNADVDQPDNKEEDKAPSIEGQGLAPVPQADQSVHKSVFIYMATNLFGLIFWHQLFVNFVKNCSEKCHGSATVLDFLSVFVQKNILDIYFT